MPEFQYGRYSLTVAVHHQHGGVVLEYRVSTEGEPFALSGKCLEPRQGRSDEVLLEAARAKAQDVADSWHNEDVQRRELPERMAGPFAAATEAAGRSADEFNVRYVCADVALGGGNY